MPISHEHKLIFIHIPKTGGTSVEMMFGINEFHDPGIYPSPQHYTGKKLESIVGEDLYNSYFKFSIVRNPYERLLSDYLYSPQGKKKGIGFEEFVENAVKVVEEQSYSKGGYRDHYIPQVEFLHKIDLLGRFEDYKRSVRRLMLKLGVHVKFEHFHRTNSQQHLDLLTAKAKEMIYGTYRRDFEELGYEP